MGRMFKCLMLSLFCAIHMLKTGVVGESNNKKLEVILDEARAVKENLTQRMDVLAEYLSDSVNLMKSMEAKFMQTYRTYRGMKINNSQLRNMGAHGGAVYIRWGNDTCPEEAELAYHGFAASGHYTNSGAGANIICAHSEPQFEKTFHTNTSKYNYLYGVEYENIWRSDLNNQDAPCAVCRSWSRTTAILVPGRHECMAGWNTEYWGFLVGSSHDNPSNSEYICLDSNPDSIEGGYQDHDGRILYNVQYQCGSLPCPPYKTGYNVPCAVCTK